MASWEAEISKELMDIGNVLRGIKHELYQMRMVELAKAKDEHEKAVQSNNEEA